VRALNGFRSHDKSRSTLGAIAALACIAIALLIMLR
jgi:hypothetical protein